MAPDTTLTVTRWEVWPPGASRDAEGARPELSGTMPHMPERYFERPNFKVFTTDPKKQPGDDGYVIDRGEWAPFAVKLGRLDPGNWELDIVCGEKAGYDDGEIAAVFLEVFGTTEAAGA